MRIEFSPRRKSTPLTLSKSVDVLTINGEAFDFTALPDGATLPREAVDCEWLADDVARVDGALSLRLILPHGVNAPHETLFPEMITAVSDGPIVLPLYEVESAEAEADETGGR